MQRTRLLNHGPRDQRLADYAPADWHHLLEGFGTPVQYSVFECLLVGGEVTRMKRRVLRTIRSRTDHVRYYHLCAACQKRTECTRGPEPVHEQHTLIV